MHSLQQVFGCLQSAIGYWLLAIGDRLFGASLRRAPKMLTGEPEDPAIIGYVCIGSSVLRLRRRVCRTQKRPSGFVGQDGVPGLSDVASGLPDVAPGVSNDGAKSGVSNDWAQSGGSEDRAKSGVPGVCLGSSLSPHR